MRGCHLQNDYLWATERKKTKHIQNKKTCINGEKRMLYIVQFNSIYVDLGATVWNMNETIQKYQKLVSYFLRTGCNHCNACVFSIQLNNKNKRAFSYNFKGYMSLSAVQTSPTVTNLCYAKKYLRTAKECVKIYPKCQNGSFLRAHNEVAVRGDILLRYSQLSM